jgi:hypothetical protein
MARRTTPSAPRSIRQRRSTRAISRDSAASALVRRSNDRCSGGLGPSQQPQQQGQQRPGRRDGRRRAAGTREDLLARAGVAVCDDGTADAVDVHGRDQRALEPVRADVFVRQMHHGERATHDGGDATPFLRVKRLRPERGVGREGGDVRRDDGGALRGGHRLDAAHPEQQIAIDLHRRGVEGRLGHRRLGRGHPGEQQP